MINALCSRARRLCSNNVYQGIVSTSATKSDLDEGLVGFPALDAIDKVVLASESQFGTGSDEGSLGAVKDTSNGDFPAL